MTVDGLIIQQEPPDGIGHLGDLRLATWLVLGRNSDGAHAGGAHPDGAHCHGVLYWLEVGLRSERLRFKAMAIASARLETPNLDKMLLT